MTILLFCVFLTSISLLPIVMYRKSQGHHPSNIVATFAFIMFFLSPVVAIVMIFQYIILGVINVILGVFS
jgi:hypothetical protein